MLRLDGEAGGRQQCFGPFFGGGPPNFHLITVNEGHTQLQNAPNVSKYIKMDGPSV